MQACRNVSRVGAFLNNSEWSWSQHSPVVSFTLNRLWRKHLVLSEHVVQISFHLLEPRMAMMHFSVSEFLQHSLPSFTCEQQPIRGVFYLVWEQLSLASCTPSVSVCETSRCGYGLITCTELVDYLKHRKQLTVAICLSLQVDRRTIRGHIQPNHDSDGNTWCHVGSCEGSYQVYRINLRGVAKTGGKSEEWPQYGVSASHQYWAAFGEGSW